VRAQAVSPDGSLVDDTKISVTPAPVRDQPLTRGNGVHRHWPALRHSADSFHLSGGGGR
jgi:hypothetical protein